MMANPEPPRRRAVKRASVEAEAGEGGRGESCGDEQQLLERLRQGGERGEAFR